MALSKAYKHLHLRKKLAVVAPSFTADCVETLEVDLTKVVELTGGMLDQLSLKWPKFINHFPQIDSKLRQAKESLSR